MASTYIRKANQTVAVKLETTPGVDAWGGASPSIATDFIRADISMTLNQQQITNPEENASLDVSAPISGATTGTLTLTCMLRGPGVAGVAPEWGKLMKICSFTEVLLGTGPLTAVGDGGTLLQVVTPFYVGNYFPGMPLSFVGPASANGSDVNFVESVPDGNTLNLTKPGVAAYTSATKLAQLSSVAYVPTSDPSLAFTASLMVYIDGLAYRFQGCAGTFTVTINNGGVGQIAFKLQGQFIGVVPLAFPGGIVTSTLQPPVLRNGMSRLNHSLLRVSTLTLDAGATLANPDNPEAAQGYDPSLVVSRNITGSINPLANVTDTVTRITNFIAGSAQPLSLAYGSSPGNRFAVVCPNIQYSSDAAQDRNGLMSEQIAFNVIGTNSGMTLTVF